MQLKGTLNETYGSRVLRTGLALGSLETFYVVNHGEIETSEAPVELLRVFSKEKGRMFVPFVTTSLMQSIDDLVNPEVFTPQRAKGLLQGSHCAKLNPCDEDIAAVPEDSPNSWFVVKRKDNQQIVRYFKGSLF